MVISRQLDVCGDRGGDGCAPCQLDAHGDPGGDAQIHQLYACRGPGGDVLGRLDVRDDQGGVACSFDSNSLPVEEEAMASSVSLTPTRPRCSSFNPPPPPPRPLTQGPPGAGTEGGGARSDDRSAGRSRAFAELPHCPRAGKLPLPDHPAAHISSLMTDECTTTRSNSPSSAYPPPTTTPPSPNERSARAEHEEEGGARPKGGSVGSVLAAAEGSPRPP